VAALQSQHPERGLQESACDPPPPSLDIGALGCPPTSKITRWRGWREALEQDDNQQNENIVYTTILAAIYIIRLRAHYYLISPECVGHGTACL
jgi:hypothetical protein